MNWWKRGDLENWRYGIFRCIKNLIFNSWVVTESRPVKIPPSDPELHFLGTLDTLIMFPYKPGEHRTPGMSWVLANMLVWPVTYSFSTCWESLFCLTYKYRITVWFFVAFVLCTCTVLLLQAQSVIVFWLKPIQLFSINRCGGSHESPLRWPVGNNWFFHVCQQKLKKNMICKSLLSSSWAIHAHLFLITSLFYEF